MIDFLKLNKSIEKLVSLVKIYLELLINFFNGSAFTYYWQLRSLINFCIFLSYNICNWHLIISLEDISEKALWNIKVNLSYTNLLTNLFFYKLTILNFIKTF